MLVYQRVCWFIMLFHLKRQDSHNWGYKVGIFLDIERRRLAPLFIIKFGSSHNNNNSIKHLKSITESCTYRLFSMLQITQSHAQYIYICLFLFIYLHMQKCGTHNPMYRGDWPHDLQYRSPHLGTKGVWAIGLPLSRLVLQLVARSLRFCFQRTGAG